MMFSLQKKREERQEENKEKKKNMNRQTKDKGRKNEKSSFILNKGKERRVTIMRRAVSAPEEGKDDKEEK